MSNNEAQNGLATALGRIPSGLFILTARHEERRAGMLTSWVQQAGFSPPMVSVAVAKGRPLLQLITSSRQFALCQLHDQDKVLLRKFARGVEADDDPFLGFDLVRQHRTSAPVLADSLCYLECELAAHLDMDSDHELLVGQVLAGENLGEQAPFVHLRKNGLSY